MTTQDEIDEGLLQSVKARKEENPPPLLFLLFRYSLGGSQR